MSTLVVLHKHSYHSYIYIYIYGILVYELYMYYISIYTSTYVNFSVSKNSCIITYDARGWLCVMGLRVRVVVPHPDVFWANCFLYTESFHCALQSYKKSGVVRISPNNAVSDAFVEHLCISLKDFCFCSINRLSHIAFI